MDRERIGLFGFSMGSSLAFHRALRDPNVRAVVAVSGLVPVDPEREDSARPDPVRWQDKGVPKARLNEVEAAMKARDIPCAVHVYPYLGHNLSIPRFFDAGSATEFFEKHLKDKATRPARGGAREARPVPS